jgi:FdhD protein
VTVDPSAQPIPPLSADDGGASGGPDPAALLGDDVAARDAGDRDDAAHDAVDVDDDGDDGDQEPYQPPTASRRVRAHRIGEGARDVVDTLAVEEPLEIRIEHGGVVVNRLVTMRTPGADLDLAAGWLLGEGVVDAPDDLVVVRPCTDATLSEEERYNVVTAEVSAAAAARAADLHRTTDVSSACGVCGSRSIAELVERGLTPVVDELQLAADVVVDLPARLRSRQRVFARTGGLHAAGLVDEAGAVIRAREDVGRHNAVDKVIGSAVLEHRPLRNHALVVSSRASYEIVQKAVSADIGMVVAISAPSSLCVDLADRFGVTVVGFVREGRATVYTHPYRVTTG